LPLLQFMEPDGSSWGSDFPGPPPMSDIIGA
jgi:hypothetical protein